MVVSVAAGPGVFYGVAVAVVTMAQAELYAVLRRSGRAPATLVGLVCGAVLMVGAYVRGPVALTLLVALPLPLLLAWALTTPVGKAPSVVASTFLGIVYGPFLAAFAGLLLREPHGVILVPAFIGVVALQDSGAYLVGRKLGRHPMSPRISPGKSWEGLLAGTVVAVGGATAVLPLFEPFGWRSAFALSLALCVAAPLGDLAESVVKRDLGVKDMGSIVPGHGGFFDRLDAILFAAPVAYLVLVVLGWARP